MKIYNSLSRQIEEIEPIDPPKIGLYTCGPTVYSTPTIGNFRTYVLADVLTRSLKYLGYQVTSVMNLTDVGHLTGDNEGDSSQGEDRLEKAAKKEGRTAWEIASYYSSEFLDHAKMLNLILPDVICKATEHIPEQIGLIQQLEEKGFTYKIADGIYFDTKRYEEMGFKYGELSTLDEMKTGARLESNPEKKNPRDFALWKFSPLGKRRQMEWDSPWGVGFPGWHIECSAMSMKYLGEQFDIHVGGEDLRSTHHPNEIAQAEGATGHKPFVKYWVHGAFLLVDGGRMGKSLGNAYTIVDITQKCDPLALRYFYLTGHYRKQINFTWESLNSANIALAKLKHVYADAVANQGDRTTLSVEKMDKITQYQVEFANTISNDLNMPEALAVVWEVAKSNIPSYDKVDLLREFDKILGLDLEINKTENSTSPVPKEVIELAQKRQELRKNKDYATADTVRTEIENKGWKLEEERDGQWSLSPRN
ncbi:MAG: cysteine--tRNA ligase [bacterium]